MVKLDLVISNRNSGRIFWYTHS